MKKLFDEIKKEDHKYTRGETLPDYYIQSRQKRFVQLFSLANHIVGTFMGPFNAYEIQQVKSTSYIQVLFYGLFQLLLLHSFYI
jgi:hypothetical protein